MPAHDTDRGLSRMRAHKGNVPSLPQTKQCSLCPAKFTRTTHLNRHLRSHTNERLHRCNICKSSEFTRSDLLTRHKRTCGQNINRSRRKSCEACAESKIKCNLQYPCAKCTSRGRECVFQNDPEESRSKSMSSKLVPRKAPCSPEVHHHRTSPPPAIDRSPSPEGSSRTSSSSPSSGLLSLPALSDSDGSSSLPSSPRSEDFLTFEEQSPFDFPFNVGMYEDPLASLLSPFDQRPFSYASPGFLSSAVLDETKSESLGAGSECNSLADGDHDMDLFTSLIRSPDPPPGMLGSALTSLMMSHPPLDCVEMHSLSLRKQSLETYLHLFFTRFLAQVPLIHAPTWKMADTTPTLRRIFHACGALFVKTPEAAAFVEATLASVTLEISEQFNTVNEKSNKSDAGVAVSHHTHLILALVLLQTIYLFQREGGGIAPSNVEHHAMLVAMIRQTDLIERVGSWIIPDWTDPISLEVAWREWVQFATIKRALLLAYFHDCCHCMYSASPPAFSPAELDVNLPCDDGLWRARTAEEWSSVAHTPSPYGTGRARIYGVSMQRALTALSPPAPSDSTAPDIPGRLQLPPFALFLLIHTVLRNIAVAQRAPPPGGWSCFALVTAQTGGADFMLRTQIVLDNWLQLWLTCPEAAPPAQEGTAAAQEPPFVCNSLPFYWLAQMSLWETSASGSGAGHAMAHPIPKSLITGWGGQPQSIATRDSHFSDGLLSDRPGRLRDQMVVDPRVSLL
ncbi:hypothetical protein B0H17DRAFT_1038568 [Mycena rosella]|uniref:Uncharacterized protein n=1 Tax=Mycena rosella TaxID=1033263 RepID=A0AAD7GTD5_MYCRO|nr:hypothetical protein B0H17DRAFT_1038568 [Mycena rosella]